MGTKISEMIEAEKIQDEDIIPIVQNNVNKKIKMKKLRTETHTTLTTTAPHSGKHQLHNTSVLQSRFKYTRHLLYG